MSFIASTVDPARRIGPARRREVFVFAEQRLGRPDWTVECYSIADSHLFRLWWRYVDTLIEINEKFFQSIILSNQRRRCRCMTVAIGWMLSCLMPAPNVPLAV